MIYCYRPAQTRFTGTCSLFRAVRKTGLWVLTSMLVLTVSAAVHAELATEQEMANVSHNFLTETVGRAGEWAGDNNPVLGETHELRYQGMLVARYYDVSPQGYVLVPVLKGIVPVKAFSDESNLTSDQEGGFLSLVAEVLYQQMQAYEEVYGNLTANPVVGGPQLFDPSQKAAWDRLSVPTKEFRASSSSGVTTQGGPLLTSSWHQGAPYNNNCPMGDGDRSVVGCVATATAQIMNFWEWPATGVGRHQYTWGGDNSCDNSTPAQDLSAVFTDDYDWANIPDNCSGGCTTAQQAALAELNYEVGVAFEMDYGACASGATTSRAASVLPTYFKYKTSIHVEYRTAYDQQGWYDLVRHEIDAGRPMQYKINSHSIVCDGYRDDGGQLQYHMNYGWNEGHTTWYVLDNLYCYWITGSVCPYEQEYIVAGIEPNTEPNVSVAGMFFYDSLADADGFAEPGESVRLNVDVVNNGFDIANAAGTLSTTDTYVTITNATALFDGLIPWGGESSTQTPFEVAVSSSCPDPHVVVFTVAIAGDGGYTHTDTVQMLVGITPGFEDDMEAGVGHWISKAIRISYTDEWHLETNRVHSGTYSWKAGGAGSSNYSNRLDAALVTPPLVVPPDGKLTFWHWIKAEDGGGATAWDGGIVMLHINGGDWVEIAPEGLYPYAIIDNPDSPFGAGTPCYSGTHDWSEAVFDLSAYAGQVVEIMFRFGSDAGATYEGWYVDDVWVGNTLAGSSVELTPYTGVTVTFNQVTTHGITTASVSPSGPEPPSGYATLPSSPKKYYSLTTDAVHTGAVQVCFAYSEADVTAREARVKVVSFDGSIWNDVTSSLDTINNLVCSNIVLPATLLVVEKLSCCVGRVGDVNNDGADEPTIGDVSVLINAKYIAGTCDGIVSCLTEADANLSGQPTPDCDDITIGDVSVLIDYLFLTGPSFGHLETCP
jgi:hypothetical protein